MAKVVVTYKTPTDPAPFVKYYPETHIPLSKKMPGLRKYEVSRGAVASPAGASGIHLIAMLSFDDIAAVQAAFRAQNDRAAAGDLKNCATGGAVLVSFDSKDA